jgi:hypothetical protein
MGTALNAFADHVRKQAAASGAVAGVAPSAGGAPGGGAAPTNPDGAAIVVKKIMISPPDQSIECGRSVQFKAVAQYSDGSNHDVTNSCAWTTSDLQRVSIDQNGLACGMSAGSATVTAAHLYSDTQGTTTITFSSSANEQQQRVKLPPVADFLQQNPPAKPAAPKEITADFFYAIIPRGDHISTTGDNSYDKPGQGLQFQVNFGIKSVTLTWGVQVSVFRDSGGNQQFAVQNVMTGPQISIDVTPGFIKEILEMDVIAQALAGSTRQEIQKSMKMVPTGQVAAGLQIQHKFALPNTKLSFVIAAQVTGGATGAQGVPATFDRDSLLLTLGLENKLR